MSEDIMSKSMVIYKLTNLIADEKGRHKFYIGQTAQTLGDRIKQHLKSDYPVGRALKKYGLENFSVEVVAEGKTIEELCMLERQFIAAFNSNDPDFGYNLTDGGEHIAGWHHTDQARANISAALSGKPFTESHKEALRQANLGENNPNYGKHLTEEHKAKLSAALSGEKNPLYGVPRSEEVKRKISETKRANGRNEEAIAKAKEASSIPVLCVETGEIFSSITEAAASIGAKRTAVSYVCHGKAKSVKGYTFRFVDTEKAQEIAERHNPKVDQMNSIAVVCIETGEIFNSLIEAAASIGINPSNISSVICGRSRTAGGKHWRRLTDNEEDIDFSDRRFRAVRCIETGIVYNSITEAANAIEASLSSVHSACNGKAQTAKGLHFEYVDPNSGKSFSEERQRNLIERVGVPVLCVETGEKFDSLIDAERATGINASAISAVCLGKGKTAGGKHWRRLDQPYEEPTEPEINPNWRAVRCLTNGIVYKSVREAAEALGLDGSAVSKNCRGKLKAVKGYVFEYVD